MIDKFSLSKLRYLINTTITNKQTNKHPNKQTNKHPNNQTNKQTNLQPFKKSRELYPEINAQSHIFPVTRKWHNKIAWFCHLTQWILVPPLVLNCAISIYLKNAFLARWNPRRSYSLNFNVCIQPGLKSGEFAFTILWSIG